MSEIEKNWLTKYMWRGDETSLPVKAEALKAASEYTIELEQQNAKLRTWCEKVKPFLLDHNAAIMWISEKNAEYQIAKQLLKDLEAL